MLEFRVYYCFYHWHRRLETVEMQGQEVCYPVYNINAVIAVEINLHRLFAEGLILKDRLAASA